MDYLMQAAVPVRDDARYAGFGSMRRGNGSYGCAFMTRLRPSTRRSLIAVRMKRCRPFLSGVAIGLACCVIAGFALASDGDSAAMGASRDSPYAYFLPQHRSVPVFTSLLATPATALSEINVTPVLV